MERRTLIRYLGSTLLVIGLIALLVFLKVAWLFRDGMGPDSVESHGWQALYRMLKGDWLGLGVIFSVICTGAYLLWRGSK